MSNVRAVSEMVIFVAAVSLTSLSRVRAEDLSSGQTQPRVQTAEKDESAKPMAAQRGAQDPAKDADEPTSGPRLATKTPEKNRPLPKSPEPKSAPVVLSQKPPAFREVPKPASQAPKPEVSEGEEGTLSLTRADYEAAHEVSATHGYDAGHTQGYTKGYAEGLATAKGKMRLLSREEAIEIGLKAARRAIERRLKKQDP